MHTAARITLGLSILIPVLVRAEQASPPQAVSISMYDSGFALVSENRRVNLAKGKNELVIRQVPARLDPSSAAVVLLAGGAGMDMLGLRFENDLASSAQLLARYLGHPLSVIAAGGTAEGKLISIPGQADSSPMVIGQGEDGARAYFQMSDVTAVNFPDAAQNAYLEPTLVWDASADQDGLQNIRLSYLVEGLSWWATHEVTLLPGSESARLSSRIGIRNESGGRFSDARVRLIATGQRAGAETAAARQQYVYGQREPSEYKGGSFNVIGQFELPRPVTIQDKQTRFFAMLDADDLPVTRFSVYDGVRFDRFQRNKQADWNYGTEYDPTVETRIEFQLPRDAAMGLPGGIVRLFQAKPDGALDFLGQDDLAALPTNASLSVRVGPARGLTGERERTGYTEVRPRHEYEETFEVRLSNLSEEAAKIRVVEHLYRSEDFDIVKADAEYITTAPQTIEFRPELQPGGRRTIRYTVRYRW